MGNESSHSPTNRDKRKYTGMLEVVSNPWRFTVGNWLCDSDLVSPTGIEQVLTEKDLLADSYSNLEASILDEKEFLLLKVISTFPELSCLICSMVGAGRGIDGVALSITHLSGRVTSSHFIFLGREMLAFVISMINKDSRCTKPITKRATTTSSGSPTQTGSSTQKGKLEGSLTQTTTVKSESSTQESPKPTTTKQTVADYAWSIQTLLALEDIGLTKIPKLAKKTWAEMASESDDDSETDLQKQIQKAKQTKTVCNQKPSQSLTQQELTPQPGNSYISKNKFFNVLQMEPEYWDKNPFKATAKVFPPGFHYRPIATNKTRKFYEFILIDTNSVSIKHFKDPKDPNLNTHSTIQILKVIQPRHYGSNLNQPKKFSAPFDPAGYNYWDYIDAWTNVFWHQNSKFKHSWLIYFKNNTAYNFPNWFLQWWNYFEPIPQILPEEVQQGFEQFNKLYNSKESRIPTDLKYFSSFALSWIFSWQYRYGKTENNKQYPPLQRHAFVKWWSQFDTSKAAPDQVKNWFQSNPEFLKPADPETSLFLNQKSQLAAFLASSKSKESLAQNLKEVLQLLQQEVEEEPSKKEAESSETNDDQEDDPFYQNEDECFGISLDDD
ncbi:hypothetical protein GmHk_20G057478 [Glycine max]|nr:hypothetical protein GmHk_20G057478 [Glycine max]